MYVITYSYKHHIQRLNTEQQRKKDNMKIFSQAYPNYSKENNTDILNMDAFDVIDLINERKSFIASNVGYCLDDIMHISEIENIFNHKEFNVLRKLYTGNLFDDCLNALEHAYDQDS